MSGTGCWLVQVVFALWELRESLRICLGTTRERGHSMREKWGLSLWRPIDKRHLRGLMDGLQEGPAAGDSSGSGHPPPSQSDHSSNGSWKGGWIYPQFIPSEASSLCFRFLGSGHCQALSPNEHPPLCTCLSLRGRIPGTRDRPCAWCCLVPKV